MSAPLKLTVDRESEIPLGTQLVWELRTLIATGVLLPGARIPGIREVAESAGVNVNTVRGVFARLEELGLLASEHGRGTFVAAGAQTHATLAYVAESARAQALEAGVDPRELAAALYVKSGVPPPTAPTASPVRDAPPAAPEASPVLATDDPAERRALRAEIARLEREFSHLDRLGTLDDRPGIADPRILTAAELREVRDQILARIKQLHREREAPGTAEQDLAAAQQGEAARVSSRGTRWRNAGVWTGRPVAGVSWTAP